MRRTLAHGLACFLTFLAALLTGCGEDTSRETPAPETPPATAPGPAPTSQDVPAPFPDLVLEVMRGEAGGDAGEVTAVPWPAGTRPRYVAGDRRAWVLAPLFGVDGSQLWDAGLVVFHGDGRRSRIPEPFRTGSTGVWCLEAGADGLPRVRAVDPQRPFPGVAEASPAPGAPATSLERVSRLRIVVSGAAPARPQAPRDTGPQAQREALLGVRIRVDDGPETRPEPHQLADLTCVLVRTEPARPKKAAWDLRAVARALAGPGARVARVEAGDGTRLVLSAEAWADASRMPVLRANRRGQLKFHWVAPQGAPAGGDALRDVRLVVFTTGR